MTSIETSKVNMSLVTVFIVIKLWC